MLLEIMQDIDPKDHLITIPYFTLITMFQSQPFILNDGPKFPHRSFLMKIMLMREEINLQIKMI